jgi:hypothetical protein
MVRVAVPLLGVALACAVVGFTHLFDGLIDGLFAGADEAARWGFAGSLALAGLMLLPDRPRLATDVG